MTTDDFASELEDAALVRLVVMGRDGKESLTVELRAGGIRKLIYMLKHCECAEPPSVGAVDPQRR